MNNPSSQAILFEHQFWLQILGDHGRFIFSNLSPKEKDEINRAYSFITTFDQLLDQSRKIKAPQQIMEITSTAFQCAKELREFKLYLLSRHLMDQVDLHLPPTFLNHMVNELEEYLRIIEFFHCENSLPCMHPLHHELLWVKDAQGHANALLSGFDETETELKKKSNEFLKQFRDLYDKAVELNGYLRTGIKEFPALCRYNSEVEIKILMFREFLCELRQLYTTKEGLGTIVPLIPDHMLREECYFLIKLSEVSNVNMPDCDPTRLRFEG
jgi:hypothetical protein